MKHWVAAMFAGSGILGLIVAGFILAAGPRTAAASARNSQTFTAAPTAAPPTTSSLASSPPTAGEQSAAAPATLPDDTPHSPAGQSPAAPASPSPAAASSSSTPALTPAQQPVHLKIDSIHLDTKVVPTGIVNGVWEVADFAAGYMNGTGLPGRPGNVAISGHDDIQGEVFRHLKSVKAGDTVTVGTPNRDYRYVVSSIRYVSPAATDVLDPTPDATLTLITCWPDFITKQAAYNSLRLIVQAKLSGA